MAEIRGKRNNTKRTQVAEIRRKGCNVLIRLSYYHNYSPFIITLLIVTFISISFSLYDRLVVVLSSKHDLAHESCFYLSLS